MRLHLLLPVTDGAIVVPPSSQQEDWNCVSIKRR